MTETLGETPVFGPVLAVATPPPVAGLAAPVKPTTVIDDATENLRTPVTLIAVRAVGAIAHQISASPACALDCAALVHVNSAPLLLMLLTF